MSQSTSPSSPQSTSQSSPPSTSDLKRRRHNQPSPELKKKLAKKLPKKSVTNQQNPSTQSQLDALVVQLQPILRHINLHRFLWGFTLVCALIAWNRGLMLLYALVAFLLAILMISYIYYALNLSGLELKASLPSENVIAGEDVNMTLQLGSRFSQHFISILLPLQRVYQDDLPPQKSSQTSITKHLSLTYCVRLFVLQSRGLQTFDYSTQLPRGVYQLSTANVSSAYPLGIIKKTRTIRLNADDNLIGDNGLTHQTNSFLNADKVYVLPASIKIERLPSYGADDRGEGYISAARKGSHDEFADIRRYRRGDAFKTVHWGASARQVSRGRSLMVKDFEALDMPRALIVLNQFIKPNQPLHAGAMDTMITLALSFARYFSQQNYQVSIIGMDAPFASLGAYWQLDIDAHTSPKADLLRKLAEIDSVAIPPGLTHRITYPAFVQQIVSTMPQSLIVQFFHHALGSYDTAIAPISSRSKGVGQYHSIYLNPNHIEAPHANISNNMRMETPHSVRYEVDANATPSELESLFQSSSSHADQHSQPWGQS